jgi:hypothetical protein
MLNLNPPAGIRSSRLVISDLPAYKAEDEGYGLAETVIPAKQEVRVDMSTPRRWNNMDVVWLTWNGAGDINYYVEREIINSHTSPQSS